jgi:hexosaminidase
MMFRLMAIIVILSTPLIASAGVADTSIVPMPMKAERVEQPSRLKTLDPRIDSAPSIALGDEGYLLDTTGDAPLIRASTPAGVFYGRQTLEQLSYAAKSPAEVPVLRITDRPRFAYRGFMLDSARHVQSVEFIKRTIDLLARYKINRMQWHLTDDVGWRVPIEKYPRLTEVGAWRGVGEKRYGGFYTREQLRDIVAYAQERFITIIPEIEMPGHAQAAVAAYPQISCRGEEVPVLAEFKLSDSPMCPSNPQTYEFIEGVLDEVMEIFPSPVIHIGGDECPRTQWKQCPRCQAMIKEKGLKSEDALQHVFTERVAAYIRGKGRRMQGWSEIIGGAELPKDVVVQQWLDASVGAKAATAGYDVVVSQIEYLYFDFTHERTPMQKAYSYDPVPAGLTADAATHIIGLQAQLWTEGLPTEADCDRNTWPRMLAVAEIAWSPKERRDWAGFVKRLEMSEYARLAKAIGADPQKLAERGRIGANAP